MLKMEKKGVQAENKKRVLAYSAIIFVVFVWGVAPLISSYVLKFYTASIYSGTGALISGIALLGICFPSLKRLNKDYLKIAVPTGFFNALANLLQKIGLQYTTPTQYAFLENLSCVAVPVLLFFLIKKKPGFLTILASALCLCGCFALSGMDFSNGGISFGKGEILCALAGLLYGVNIAVTGAFAKKFNPALYVMVQTWVNVVVSFASAILLNFVKINGAVVESIVFSWRIDHLLMLAGCALIISTFCWILRTNAMKYVSASFVAVMMPFSSVVTGVSSVAFGTDSFNANLLIGGALVFLASLLCGMEDVVESKREETSIKKFLYEREKIQNAYVVNEVEVKTRAKRGDKLSIRIVVDSVDIARNYEQIPLCIRLKNQENEKTFKKELDIRNWLDGNNEEKLLLDIPKEMPKGEYSLQMKRSDKDDPSVIFATEEDEEYFVLTKVRIV